MKWWWLVLLGCVRPPHFESRRGSPLVVSAEKIYTNDASMPFAQALLVHDGEIRFVGSRVDAIRLAGPQAVVEHFEGATIVPGLGDAHLHLQRLGESLTALELKGTGDEAQAAAVLRAAPPNREGWVFARGWAHTEWPGGQLPTSASLAERSTPLVAERDDGQAVWVNRAALTLAGVTFATNDTPDGRIVRDEFGAPTGVLLGTAADLVRRLKPRPTDETLQQQLTLALEHCARLGLTTVHDVGMSLRTLNQLVQWDALALLPVRVVAMADGDGPDADEFLGRGPFVGQKLRLPAVSLTLDEQFAARARAFDSRGFQVAVHASAAQGLAPALDVLSTLSARRHRIEDAGLMNSVEAARAAKAGLAVSVQPRREVTNWRSLGATYALGSDAPAQAPNPLWGLFAARTRADAAGTYQTGAEALAGLTSGVAWVANQEARAGQLAVGLAADFVVLPIDPVDDEPRRLLEAQVSATIVAGVDVYRRPGR